MNGVAASFVLDAIAGRKPSGRLLDADSMRLYRFHHSRSYRVVKYLITAVFMTIRFFNVVGPPLSALESLAILYYAADVLIYSRYHSNVVLVTRKWFLSKVLFLFLLVIGELLFLAGAIDDNYASIFRFVFLI